MSKKASSGEHSPSGRTIRPLAPVNTTPFVGSELPLEDATNRPKYFSACDFNNLKIAVQAQEFRKTVLKKKFPLVFFQG